METVNVDVAVSPVKVTLEGLNEAAGRPVRVALETVALRATVRPEKPKLFRVIVAVFEVPATMLTTVGLAEMLKSPVTVT